jgi:gamma-glutamyltranspeptidase/glutathione hydrolase
VTLWVTPDPTYGPALLDALAGPRSERGGLPEAVAGALARVRGDRDPAGVLPEGTSAVAATDAEGNTVVLVHSNSHPQFGSGLVVEPYDLILSNRAGRGFSAEPGHPNAPAPGRRPRTTLHAWAIDFAGGGRAGLLGATPGGEQQVAWNAQVISALLARGPEALGDILTGPRWSLSPDGPVPADDQATAVRPAHVVAGSWAHGLPAAAADPRIGATAVGV